MAEQVKCEHLPQIGETYKCTECGMVMTCVVNCDCDPADTECLPVLSCCGQMLLCLNPQPCK